MADKYNIQLLNRQIEISEWTYQDRMETLFVFQVLFIALMIVAILLYLRGAGLLGTAFVVYASILLIIVIVIIIVNRSMYTNRIRDKRTWNRRDFEEDNRLGSPLKQAAGTEYANYVAALEAKYGTAPTTSTCNCPK
jgi:hypothetical protein